MRFRYSRYNSCRSEKGRHYHLATALLADGKVHEATVAAHRAAELAPDDKAIIALLYQVAQLGEQK